MDQSLVSCSEEVLLEMPILEAVSTLCRAHRIPLNTDIRKVKIGVSIKAAIIRLSGRNVGAVKVCENLVEKSEKVDPNAFGGKISSLLLLDKFRIYEHRIYILWNDVCKGKTGDMIAVLRACSLGLPSVTKNNLKNAIDNELSHIDIPEVIRAVKERVPIFYPERG